MPPPSPSPADLLRRVNSEEPSIWDRLRKEDSRFGLLGPDDQFLPLTSYADSELPPLSRRLPILGRFMIRHSPFARILARRVGKEEVTFYSLLNEPEGTGISRALDRHFLKVGGPPLNWRRDMVVQHVRESLAEALAIPGGTVTFWDIGSGGGFDSLDVARQMSALARKTGNLPDVRLVNVDVDGVWLGHNEALAKALYPPEVQARFCRRHLSIFDYLESAQMRDDLAGTRDLIVSCNGFADFFTLEDLRRLIAGIGRASEPIPGAVRMVFPMAMINKTQQLLSKLVGFDYRARPRQVFEELLREGLPNFGFTATERHSQVVFRLSRERRAGSGIAP